ncbi:hypothetical protein Tco_0130135, partial [Tanacetum coccineum]
GCDYIDEFAPSHDSKSLDLDFLSRNARILASSKERIIARNGSWEIWAPNADKSWVKIHVFNEDEDVEKEHLEALCELQTSAVMHDFKTANLGGQIQVNNKLVE